MPNLPYFPFYVNDWLGSTTIACLAPEQEGGFIRLLAHAWNKPDCVLSGTEEDLMALSRLDSQALAGLLAKAFQRCEGGYFNIKQRRVRKEYESFSKTMSKAGKKGAEVKKLLRMQRKDAEARLQPSSSQATSQEPARNQPSLALASSPSSTSLKSKSKDTPSPKKAMTDTRTNKRSKEDYVFVGIPDWIEQRIWDEYVAMRKRIRAPLTDWAMHLTVLDLDALRGKGHDPNKVLNQSSQKSWRGVFPLNEGGTNGSSQVKSFAEREAERQERIREESERILRECAGSTQNARSHESAGLEPAGGPGVIPGKVVEVSPVEVVEG